jgi:thiamine-monophosphate kinase
VDKFMRGFLSLAKQFAVPLAGGDTAESPAGILADIVLLGSVPQGKAILRSGARPGNPIYVTGALGGSAATIELLRRSGPGLRASEFAAHFAPTPRVEVGRVLREKKIALAMIDISDGLSTDLAHMCEGSGVGAEIEAEAIPLGRIGRPSRPVDLRLALHGGDDYELLFAASPHVAIPARIAGVPITRIGRITRSRHLVLIAEGKRRKLVPQGWQHFRA